MRNTMTYLTLLLVVMTMLTGCVVWPAWDDGYYRDGGGHHRHHGHQGYYDRRR